MEKRIEKLSIKVIICTLLMIACVFIIGTNNAYAREIFKDNTAFNWDQVPAHLFADNKVSLWCSEHGAWLPVEATSDFKDYVSSGTATYDGVTDHREAYNTFKANSELVINGRSNKVASYIPDYEGDNQEAIDRFNKIYEETFESGTKTYKSVDYNPTSEVLSEAENQDKLFVFSAMPQYDGLIPLEPENLTEEQKAAGYFNVKEKQFALWYLMNENDNSGNDRGLGNIAKRYQAFYNSLKENGYTVNAFSGYDKNGNREKNNVVETTTDMNGAQYKTYVYKNTKVEVDKKNNSYILGPYYIDYTEDGTETTDGYKVSFSAIDNITVYNQNKTDITTLGGSFKIAYSYKLNENTNEIEIEEGKVTTLDGREINGFESGKEFYIVIYRGNMTAEQFKGFYAKIDFKYIDHITGTMTRYYGQVYEYSMSRSIQNNVVPYASTYTYGFGYYHSSADIGRGWCNNYSSNADETRFWCNGHYGQNTVTAVEASLGDRYIFKFTKTPVGTAQGLLGITGTGTRYYGTASIILTSDWEEEEPSIEIYKQCKTDGENLYGAKFIITLNIDGTDIYGNTIKKTLTFTRITDNNGITKVDSQAIKAEGVSLGTFTGRITATLEETETPAGHGKMQDKATMVVNYEKGKAISVSGENTVLDKENNIAGITIFNVKSGTPKIQIAKVDKNNKLIEEAYFEVHVSYTNSEGKLVDKKVNIIRGQTQGGVLNLTKEDFKNMPEGFDIEGYTGKITLDIVEVKVSGAFSISSDNKDITLEYNNGNLVNYTEYTNEEVVVQYLYNSVRDNVYKYATGQIRFEELNKYVQDFLTDWVAKQQKNVDMSYEDILAWLAEYIDENKQDVMETSTKLTTEVLNGVDKDTVQIVVEDSIGDLPDIPKKPTPQPTPFFMTVAGKVFLDQSTTKASENESNGLFDEGELLLSGIEVRLYKKDGTLAKLVQEEGQIRTNPTMTDENGYYEFAGVDPFEEYYVVFVYNGMEYKNTISSEREYNSVNWSKSSKGSEVASDRNTFVAKYAEIGPNTNVYDYYQIQSIYTEIAARVLSYVSANNAYPNMESIYSSVIANHKDDSEIAKKIEYIKVAAINAYAGYSSKEAINTATSNGVYPYYKVDRSILNEYMMNADGETTEFAGDKILSKLYPGQLQVNLGLVERDRTDLSLLTDIVETTVSMNAHDTTYEMNKDKSEYTQYIHEEDYNYSKDPNANGVAFYTEDDVEFYLTYEINVNNETLTNTAVTEIVDYFDENFVYENEYTTSKGNKIAGYKAYLNGQDITNGIEISSESRYGISAQNRENTNNTGYKEIFVRFKNGYMIKDNDKLVIQLTFKMDKAQATLYSKLYTEKNSSEYSKLWKIGNYAEINGYLTQGAYLDKDSRPGNFSIVKYEAAKKAYQEAYANYVKSRTEENSRGLKQALGRLTDAREDDAWTVGLTLANNGYTRSLSGSVWEAISNKVKTSTDLQNNQNGLLTYVQDNGLSGITVELVELEKNGSQAVRGKTTTDAQGNYKFTSYIAGDYVVRFVYGEQDKDIRGKSLSKSGETLQVNGQYYESTKANPNTDKALYWYDEDKETRYSDAYDDAKSRLTQMTTNIDGTNSTSSDYEFDALYKVASYNHKDTIYAYTSTLNLEVEYVKDAIAGDKDNTYYPYTVSNIDFGVTPRASAELNIAERVSNIKVYLQDGTLELDADISSDGTVKLNNDPIHRNIVLPNYDSKTYLDGLIEALVDEELYNGAILEITYDISVTNNGQYDTIKYIYNANNAVVAVAYYGEDYNSLPFYESDRENGSIVYHDGASNEYSLEKYSKEAKTEVRTSALNVVDYIDPNLNFIGVNKAGKMVNTDWEVAEINAFNTSRKSAQDIMNRYNTIIRAKNTNRLFTKLLPSESTSTTLTLSKVLETTSTETNDYEYSNLVEIAKIHSDSGRITDLKGYSVTGYSNVDEIDRVSETSTYRRISDIKYPIYPTLGTAKSETVVIHAPTGLSMIENIQSNTIIVLVVIVVFAAGVVLIKKFVLNTKKN